MLLLAAAAALLLAASPAQARMHAGPSQLHAGHRLQGAIAPLDGGGSLASPAAAYSLRKLKSTYAGPGVKLRRASDSATQDINFLGFTGFTGAPLNVAAANTFCSATTCFIDTWYDQTGNARHWLQAAAASQPQFIADCGGGLPCMQTVGSKFVQAAAQVTPAGAQSLSTVARVDGAAQACTFMSAAFNAVASTAGPTWVLDNNLASTISGAASPSAWHAANGVVNGAASVFNVDGTETPGTLTINAGINNFYGAYGGGGANTCSEREAIWWQTYALTAAERAALRANQQSFWGTP